MSIPMHALISQKESALWGLAEEEGILPEDISWRGRVPANPDGHELELVFGDLLDLDAWALWLEVEPVRRVYRSFVSTTALVDVPLLLGRVRVLLVHHEAAS